MFLGALIGGLIGAAAGAVNALVTNWDNLNKWEEVKAAAAGGASGLVADATFSSMGLATGVGIGLGAAGGALGEMTRQAILYGKLLIMEASDLMQR